MAAIGHLVTASLHRRHLVVQASAPLVLVTLNASQGRIVTMFLPAVIPAVIFHPMLPHAMRLRAVIIPRQFQLALKAVLLVAQALARHAHPRHATKLMGAIGRTGTAKPHPLRPAAVKAVAPLAWVRRNVQPKNATSFL